MWRTREKLDWLFTEFLLYSDPRYIGSLSRLHCAVCCVEADAGHNVIADENNHNVIGVRLPASVTPKEAPAKGLRLATGDKVQYLTKTEQEG